MELQQLKGFLAVARQKNFSQAAKKTFRTQSAISLQIQALEKELGVKLFDRLGGRKVAVTEEGQLLFDLTAPLVDDFETLKVKFDELLGREKKGKVRIATSTSVMVYLLPEVIQAFKKKMPQSSLSILNRGREDILSLMNSGEVDIGITSLKTKTVPESIDYKKFASFKRLLIGPKGHPLSRKSSVTPADIAKYPLLLSPKGSNTRAVVDSVFENLGLEYNLAMESTGKMAIKTFVEMDLGLSIVNEFYIAKDDRKNIFTCDVSKYFGTAERAILTRKNRYLSRAAEAFKKILLEKYKCAV